MRLKDEHTTTFSVRMTHIVVVVVVVFDCSLRFLRVPSAFDTSHRCLPLITESLDYIGVGLR